MQIDCDRCTARGPGCGDCVVAVILGEPPAGTGLERTGPDNARRGHASHDRTRLERGRPGRAHLDQARLDQACLDHARLDHARLDHARLDHADLDDDDWAALQVLADSGLVSTHRLGTAPVRSRDRGVRGA